MIWLELGTCNPECCHLRCCSYQCFVFCLFLVVHMQRLNTCIIARVDYVGLYCFLCFTVAVLMFLTWACCIKYHNFLFIVTFGPGTALILLLLGRCCSKKPIPSFKYDVILPRWRP